MAEFPHELFNLLSSGIAINYDSAVLRTQFDAGPPKVRTFQCRTMKVLKFQYHACDCDAIETFETWFKEDTKLGSLFFKWQDPCSKEFKKARFRTEPSWSSEGQTLENWTLTVELEIWC